ncbi:MAG: (d)CMP kinase [Chitinophagaceae bacterium]
MKKINIAIDGYSSCGKSTLARQLAQTLHYVFIDSGSMYRAITLYFIRHQVNLNHAREILEALQKIQLEFVRDPSGRLGSGILLNDEPVEHLIRELPVSQKVSEVASLGPVREFAVAQQQQIGLHKGIVMDGRDIGTVVFPHAELKIFMTADMAIRVERRFLEWIRKNPQITLEEVKENLASRDYIDTHREISPLRQAPDAIVLDNSKLTMPQQLNHVLKLAQQLISTL